MYIDPYNLIRIEKNKHLSTIKSEISLPLNYRLYKLSNFLNNPTDVVLLGDSRVDAINTSYFDNLNGKKSTNLAYGGGSLSEIIESFWFVSNIHNLKEVYIGINFNLWNKNNDLNLVNEALNQIQSPINYVFSNDCLKSTFLILKTLIFEQEKIDIEKPNLSKSEFWKDQLESSANNFYKIWSYPTGYMFELSQIANYCKLNNIKLVFFTPPTHIDLQSKVIQFNLVSEELNFKSDLSKLGTYYDFDFPNEITENNNLFNDPFHSNDSVTKIVINEILSGELHYAKKKTKP